MLRDLPFSNTRAAAVPSGPVYGGQQGVVPSSSASFSGQIQPLTYSSSYGMAAQPYPSSSSASGGGRFIPTPAQTAQNIMSYPQYAQGSSATAAALPPSPGVERFPCDKCDRSFSRSHDRKRHYESHHLQTPHLCPTCGKDFSRSDSLKRHIDNGCERIRATGH